MKGFVNLTHTNNKKIADLREELNKKQNSSPTANIPLINTQTGKLDNAYIPTNISGTSRVFAGTFGEDGVIVASAYASEINGQLITEINLSECVGYEFSYTGETPFLFDDIEVNKNDLIMCNGDKEPNWTLYDNSDKVVSVNGQTGAVQINIPEAGIEHLVGTEENPINMATDMEVGHLYSVSGYITKDVYGNYANNNNVLIYKSGKSTVKLFNATFSGVNIFSSDGAVLSLRFNSETGYLTSYSLTNAVKVNGGEGSTMPVNIYAPTSGGTAGQILQSNGNSAPAWITPNFATLDDITNAINGAWEGSY